MDSSEFGDSNEKNGRVNVFPVFLCLCARGIVSYKRLNIRLLQRGEGNDGQD